MKKFVEFFELAVRQGIHRIDDDSTGSRGFILVFCLQYPINDWNKKDSDLPEPVPVVTT